MHDEFYLFSHAGVLEHDIQIGNTFRVLRMDGNAGHGYLVYVALFAQGMKPQMIIRDTICES